MVVMMMLFAGGCAKVVSDKNDDATKAADAAAPSGDTMTPDAEPTGVQDVDVVSNDLQEIDTTEKDLDSGSLDTLDQDLENLDW